MPGLSDSERPAQTLRELLAAGRYQEALGAYRVLARAEASQAPELQLMGATAATRLGDFSAGVALAESALGQFRARADADGRMRTLNLLGVIAIENGRLDEAESCLGDALTLARQLGDGLMEARSSNNLASIADMRGRGELALSLYRVALLSYQRLGDRRGAVETYHNLGLTFRQLERWQEAEDATGRAVHHAGVLGERALLALALTGRAETALGRGGIDVARREAERAAQLARQAADPVGEADVGRLRGLIELAGGDAEAALREAEAARNIAERVESVLLQGECAAVAARALRRLARSAEADNRYVEAVTIFNRLGAARLLKKFQEAWEEVGPQS